jgi:AraC-like DNA-binding protein
MATGGSFRDLGKFHILNKARELLATCPNISIKQLSFELGYKSLRAFDRFILKSCGLTPTSLRKTLRSRREI